MADAERVVQVTYKIEGAEEAAEAQDRIGESAESAGRKLEEQSDIARASEQVYQRQQQALNDLNEAFSGLSSILGSESELGSVLGRMSHSAQVGRQLGSALGGISPQLGPLASVLGTLTGAAIPAINALFDALTPTVPALIEVTEETRRTSEAVI
ncbi:MAG: hypothetical protein EBR88_07220, partial [Betaproteobacteria bacterium]|nr:hypothetical protein [Betaproteobacteria bacterium]